MLDTASPEALFVLSGVAQYVGATLAVTLFDQAPARTVAWLRVVGAAIALCAVSWRHVREVRRWTGREFAAAAVFGTATALMNLFFYLAIDRIDLGRSVTIEFIGPIAVAAARTRTARNAGSLALAGVGVMVLGGLSLGESPVGLAFVGLASLMWAAYIVVGAHVARLERGAAGLGVGLAVGALVLVPIGAPGSGAVWASPGLLGACLLVGVFSNAIGYGIDQKVMRRLSVRRFSVLLAVLPVIAVIMGWIVLDQAPGPLEVAGIVLVLVGVMLQDRDEIAIADAQPS